jgi:hypothetical protein
MGSLWGIVAYRWGRFGSLVDFQEAHADEAQDGGGQEPGAGVFRVR